MSTSSILFTHEIGLKDSREVAKRRATLLKSLPELEKSYKKAQRSKKLSSLIGSKKDRDEALKFYNAVVADGRFIKLLAKDPQGAADKLGLNVRKEVVNQVERFIVGIHGPGTVQGPVEAVIAVAVVIAVAISGKEFNEEQLVIDSSANISLKL